MNKKKRIVSAAVCAALFAALTTGALGASSARSIEVIFDGISITLNGERVETADANGKPVEPFIYDGTTYIPVRAVAEAFGKDVEWLPEAGEVAIKDSAAIDGAAHTGGADETLNDYLIAKSVALSAKMTELAASDEYVRAMTGSPAIADAVNEIRAGDYANPQYALIIKATDDFLDGVTDAISAAANNGENIPKTGAVYEQMRGRYFRAMPSMLNGMHGAEMLAAATVLSTTESYQGHRELYGEASVLLDFSGNYAIWVSFRHGEEDTVMASAQFVLMDEEMQLALASGSLDDLFDGVLFAGSFAGLAEELGDERLGEFSIQFQRVDLTGRESDINAAE